MAVEIYIYRYIYGYEHTEQQKMYKEKVDVGLSKENRFSLIK